MIKVTDVVNRAKLLLNDAEEIRYSKNILVSHYNMVQDDLFNEAVGNKLDIFKETRELTLSDHSVALPEGDAPVAEIRNAYGQRVTPVSTYTDTSSMRNNYYIADGYLYSDKPSVTFTYYKKPTEKEMGSLTALPDRLLNLVARLVSSHASMQYDVYRRELIFFKRDINASRITRFPDTNPFK